MLSLLGAVGFGVLVFLPGSWVTFGLPLSGLRFWAKFLTGSVLSPLVAVMQFYVLRLIGVPFELTALLLVGMNLPALYLIFKQMGQASLPKCRTLLSWLLVVLVPVVFFALHLLDGHERVYSGHAWMHADIVYMVANGDLVLEEPELAGIRLSIPWAGHIYQGILSYLIGSPPVSNYMWTNLLWLVFTFGFAAGLVDELGGDNLSKVASVVWLSFGANSLGYVLQQIVPVSVVQSYPIWGDYRYTPWLVKFFSFSQTPFALGLFIATAYLSVRSSPDSLRGPYLALIGLLLCGVGLIYPILFLATCGVVGAKAIQLWFDRSEAETSRRRKIAGLGIAVLIAGAVSLIHLNFIGVDRVTEAVKFSLRQGNESRALQKVADSFIVVFPFLVSLALVFPRCWHLKRAATTVLLLTAIVSLTLYILLDIPHRRNEYKFMFTAAICLAPFASIALELVRHQWGIRTVPALAAVTLILAVPFAHNVVMNNRIWSPRGREVDLSGFDLRLSKSEHFAGLLDAIRQRTPTNSILILDRPGVHFPTLTRRRLYAPSDSKPHPGVNLNSRYILIDVRGHAREILENRRSVLRDLFHYDGSRRAQSLDRILQLNRPVAIVLYEQCHTALLQWLATDSRGVPIFRENGFVLWLIDPRES